MRVIEQSSEILDWSGLDLYRRIETAARVCRRSESKGDAEGFVRSLVRRGHFPPLEFARIVCFNPDTKDFGENIISVRYVLENEYFQRSWVARELSKIAPVFVETLCPADFPKDRLDCYVEPANDWIPVLIITSRTISHQLVRYRHNISFCQESQRHCRYDREGIEVIEPPGLDNERKRIIWEAGCCGAEACYRNLMEAGATAEQARAVLPGCTATRILAYASPEEWRHIFSQRCDSHADPQMSALMRPLQEQMKDRGLI